MIYITKHAINKAEQRFRLTKGYKETKALLKKALEEGKIIEQMNKYDCVIEYNKMYLVVESDVVKTVLTKEQYEYNKNTKKIEPIGEGLIRK